MARYCCLPTLPCAVQLKRILPQEVDFISLFFQALNGFVNQDVFSLIFPPKLETVNVPQSPQQTP